MDTERTDDEGAIARCKTALDNAIERDRSAKWQLRLWSRLIKTRDGYRCLCCEGIQNIQAHHIIRRTSLPAGSLDTGNGITLCRKCHCLVHAQYNQRPNPHLPMGADQGDDQNEWSFLFGLLMDDGTNRSLPQNELYFISPALLEFSVFYQGYDGLLDSVKVESLSRIRFMHEIWRAMPEQFYSDLAVDLIFELLASNRQRS